MINKNNWFYRAAIRLWPDTANMEGVRQIEAVTLFVPLLTLLPFAGLGLIWLVMVTDYEKLSEHVAALLVGLVTLLLLQNQSFTIRLKFSEGDELGLTSSLAGLVLWSAALIVGPSALWMIVLSSLVAAVWQGWQDSRHDISPIWPSASIFVQVMSGRVFAMLVALSVYVGLGGTFPLEDVTFSSWAPVILATIISAVIPGILLLPTAVGYNNLIDKPTTLGQLTRFFLGAVTLTLIMTPFSLLAALIFLSGRTIALIVFIAGIFLVNALAYYLSEARDRSQRRAREFEELEKFGEEILKAPPIPAMLGEILESHLSKMFPEDRVEVRLFESLDPSKSQPLHIYHPRRHVPVDEDVWQSMCNAPDNYITYPKVTLQGHSAAFGDATAVKILAGSPSTGTGAVTSGGESICLGGIYLLRSSEIGQITDALASVHSLASQVSSSIYRMEIHNETIARHKMEQELEFAGHIQHSFLPASIPVVNGWGLAAVLESARQTSGDFYDFIPLAENRLGLLVADVADKGTGAALYMALSRTLIRTYAMDNPTQPEIAFTLANDRILSDAKSDQFVTAFYGVLDCDSGLLTYVNAGHNPPYVIHGSNGHEVKALGRTGIPLGMFEGMKWEQAQTQIDLGDILVLYTDGVTEAQNLEEDLYDDERLLTVGASNLGMSAGEIQKAIVDSIHGFVGRAPQFDDITLMVISRNSG